jgi:hypothetical protein
MIKTHKIQIIIKKIKLFGLFKLQKVLLCFKKAKINI